MVFVNGDTTGDIGSTFVQLVLSILFMLYRVYLSSWYTFNKMDLKEKSNCCDVYLFGKSFESDTCEIKQKEKEEIRRVALRLLYRSTVSVKSEHISNKIEVFIVFAEYIIGV